MSYFTFFEKDDAAIGDEEKWTRADSDGDVKHMFFECLCHDRSNTITHLDIEGKHFVCLFDSVGGIVFTDSECDADWMNAHNEALKPR